MAALLSSSSFLGFTLQPSHYFTLRTDKWNISKLDSLGCRSIEEGSNKRTQLRRSSCRAMCSISSSASATTVSSSGYESSKKVWIWTANKEVMTASVERGWNTFIFPPKLWDLADEWASIAFIRCLFIGSGRDGEILDAEDEKVATIFEVSSPEELQLQLLKPETEFAENVIIDLLDWQIIPAENIVAAFQRSRKTVFAISKTASEAQIFLEALELGLGGVVLKVDDVEGVIMLKEYFDKRNESRNLLCLTKATVTRVQTSGMGDRVCVDLCSLMTPGEGLLVGSFARGLFLVHSECVESNYIASRPFRVNAGPVHAYVSVPGGKTCYLSELKAGSEVIVVDQKGQQRTAIVGRVKIETRPLVLVEAKINSDDKALFSIFLQNAETVALIPPCEENSLPKPAIPVTSLKVGDEVLLRVQGAARHTGIEIQEFIVEN